MCAIYINVPISSEIIKEALKLIWTLLCYYRTFYFKTYNDTLFHSVCHFF